MNRKRRLIPDKEKLKTHVRLNEHQVNSSIRWNDMPWKKVSTSNVQGIDDSIFFGLEELDGNYLKKIRLNESSSKTMETESKNDINDNAKDANDIKEPKKKSNRKSLTKLRRENSKVNDPTAMQSQSTDITTDYEQYSNQSLWGDISLNTLLCESLVNLGFRSPTPIQREAIPKTIQADSDIVGVAETGSGKTLAFGLPILNSIIHSYVTSRRKDMYTQPFSRCPQALIIAPTRELAMQISSVLKEICLQMKEKIKIEIVCVVGGMSEQKQRRLLCSTLKPVDIVVGTPGRLCELIQDQEIAAFQDLSRLKFLVVDEADRIMEDGHFPELHRLFHRILDHEKIASNGKDVVETLLKRQEGTYEDEFHASNQSGNKSKNYAPTYDDGDDPLQDLALQEFDTMPTEEEMEIEREKWNNSRQQQTVEVFYDSTPQMEAVSEAFTYDDDNDDDLMRETTSQPTYEKHRLTLLYSATATDKSTVSTKALKKKIKGLGQGDVRNLPAHLQGLLKLVALKKNTHVIDVTSSSQKKGTESKKATENNDAIKTDQKSAPSTSIVSSLPSTLEQYEIRMPNEEKDVITYFFLLQHPGRALIFVNSIKTARRLDGLLRALRLDARTIHAQLQQRQRLRALDAYKSNPKGILVATDVAARGLDITGIQYVIHYDVARSPQVYVHRSGRTARAGSKGVTVSMVAPEDSLHHSAICQSLGCANLSSLRGDLSILPQLHERVKLAKKIFTQSFVHTKELKELNWIQNTAQEADLDIDDELLHEVGDSVTQEHQNKMTKKELHQAKLQLQELLDTPYHGITSQQGTKSSFNQFKKNKKGKNSNFILSKPKRSSFIVYAK